MGRSSSSKTKGSKRSRSKGSSSSKKSTKRSRSSGTTATYSVPRQPGKEIGYLDYAISDVEANSTGELYLANAVAQGAGHSQRVGKYVALKSIQVRGAVKADTSGSYSNVVIMVIYDKRPTGNLPAITDVLNSVSPFSMNKDANSGRFRILRRQTYEVVGAAAASWITAKSMHNIDFYLSLKDRPTVFKEAGTGAIGDIEEGAVYICILSETATGATAPTVSLAHRVRYNDL